MNTPNKPQDRKPSSDSEPGSIQKSASEGKFEKKAVPAHMEKPTARHVDALDLPKGALIAYRRSGGVKFSSRSIAVYIDGRVITSAPDIAKPAHPQVSPNLSSAQLNAMRKLLDQCNFFGLRIGGGNQPPDTYAHEILARIDNRSNLVEVFDGGIPDALKPLLELLNSLLPKE